MLYHVLFAVLQGGLPAPHAATIPPPVANPQPPAIDVTASMAAYRDWRICLEAALATDARRSARVRADAAFGPGGTELADRFRRDTRAELGATRPSGR